MDDHAGAYYTNYSPEGWLEVARVDDGQEVVFIGCVERGRGILYGVAPQDAETLGAALAVQTGFTHADEPCSLVVAAQHPEGVTMTIARPPEGATPGLTFHYAFTPAQARELATALYDAAQAARSWVAYRQRSAAAAVERGGLTPPPAPPLKREG